MNNILLINNLLDCNQVIEIEVPQNLPFLNSLCWQREGIKNLTPLEMLKRYERGWYYRGVLGELSIEEAIFVKELAKYYGSWLESTIFNQEFHQKIITVLRQLNSNFLLECGAYFGGGTLVSLSHGEYRLSKDIDFICAVGKGYRLLRQEVANQGCNAIFSSSNNIKLPGEIQANQYGVRFPVIVEETRIKFEIVSEGRIQLGKPDYFNWSSVPCLNKIDCFAEKLLANADRWLDTSVESRDLIDLAIQRLETPIPTEAIDKAEEAYPVIDPLKKAIINFQQKSDYRQKCFASLRITEQNKVIEGIDLLAKDLGLEETSIISAKYQEEMP